MNFFSFDFPLRKYFFFVLSYLDVTFWFEWSDGGNWHNDNTDHISRPWPAWICLQVFFYYTVFFKYSVIIDRRTFGSSFIEALKFMTIIWGVLTMISNYHYLKQIFSSVHFLIGVQWLGTNCQMKHVRWGILLALNLPYLRI